MNNRIKWIDNAKGCAIILVLLGHFLSCTKLTAIIYAFHMPLFFFLSGYVFSLRKYENVNSFELYFNEYFTVPNYSLNGYTTLGYYVDNRVFSGIPNLVSQSITSELFCSR